MDALRPHATLALSLKALTNSCNFFDLFVKRTIQPNELINATTWQPRQAVGYGALPL
jgi:hypothetical protein